MVAPGIAVAAEETTTTTEATTTTIEPSTTTTTTEGSTTSTLDPGSTTTTTFPYPTTTSVPSSTTTTTTSPSTTAPEDPDVIDPDPLPPDPEPPVEDFIVGQRRPPAIVFPLAGDHSFIDTFGAPRDGGSRRHAGIDIFAEKRVPVLAVADGVVEAIDEKPKAGQYVIVRHDDGWRSKYLHLNNDTPGTEDGLAVGYEPAIGVGSRVLAGTVIGYVGNSGNAETTAPHLHFSLHQPDRLPVNPYRALVAAPEVTPIFPSPLVKSFNTELVGFFDPDRSGFNAGLAVWGDHVLMGTWGNDWSCPGTGVRVIDVTNPGDPVTVARFAGRGDFPGTAADSLWVGEVETSWFDGVMAVVAIRLCDQDDTTDVDHRFAGIAIYDITDPEAPVLMSSVHSGDDTRGADDVDVLIDDVGRVLAAATVSQPYLDDPEQTGDLHIYDLTNPRLVSMVSHWDLRRGAPLLLVEGLKARFDDDRLGAARVTWAGSERLIVGNGSAGLLSLDVSDPTDPVYLGTTSPLDTYALVFGPADPGHDASEAADGWLFTESVLVQDDERLEQEGGERTGNWGRQVFYDMSDPSRPAVMTTFETENSHLGLDDEVRSDGFYSPRQSALLDGGHELVAWMSDGVRIVGLTDPAHPFEAGFFVPPSRFDPQGWWVAPDGSRSFPLVWDVATDGDLVYAVDVNSGLWVFRVTQPLLASVPRPE